MKLTGQNLDTFLREFEITRRDGEEDKALRLRARKRLKKNELWLPYFELKKVKTSEKVGLKDNKFWDNEVWSDYKAFMRSLVADSDDDEGQQDLGQLKGNQAVSKIVNDEDILTTDVSRRFEAYEEEFENFLMKPPTIIYGAFEKAFHKFHQDTTRWPKKIYFNPRVYMIVKPILLRLDQYSEVKQAISKAQVFTKVSMSMSCWQFEV